MNAGIDYGRGETNIDTETGIRYGVIGINDLSGDAMEDVYSKGEDLDFQEYRQRIQSELKAKLHAAVDEFCNSEGIEHELSDGYFEDIAVEMMDELSFDFMGTGDCARYFYQETKENGETVLAVQTTGSNTMFVFKSKYVTKCRFCSPCYPGAGDLATPDEDGVWTYHPGLDWYDEDRPYEGEVWEIKGGDKVKIYPEGESEDEDSELL